MIYIKITFRWNLPHFITPFSFNPFIWHKPLHAACLNICFCVNRFVLPPFFCISSVSAYLVILYLVGWGPQVAVTVSFYMQGQSQSAHLLGVFLFGSARPVFLCKFSPFREPFSVHCWPVESNLCLDQSSWLVSLLLRKSHSGWLVVLFITNLLLFIRLS